MYDSKGDTIKHRLCVRKYMEKIVSEIKHRIICHDRSKEHSPEKPIFDKVTPELKKLEYGSNDYKEKLKEMQVALDHHYANNSHHPEHYKNGIMGMDLIDLIEMICDWKAATERNANGDIMKSIEINQKRFNYSDELKQILINTVERIINPIQYENSETNNALANSFDGYN